MKGPHHQGHATLRCCGHMTNKIRYISSFTRSMASKLWWLRIKKSYQQSHAKLRSRGYMTNKKLHFSQGLWVPNLAGWWIRMRGTHPQSHVTIQLCDHVASQKYFISFIRCKAHKFSRLVTRMRRWHPTCLWRRGVVVITTAQLHSAKPELRFCAGSNPVHSGLEIRDGEDLWQWPRLEIRLNAFRRSTIPQKQFIIIMSRQITTDHAVTWQLPNR